MKSVVAGLFAAVDASSSVCVRWTQNGLSTLFRAVPGRTLFDVETDDGIVQSTETRDWLFPTERLCLGGRVHLPARGARVEELDDDGNVIAAYAVNHPGGDKHYRYTDQFRQVLRVHSVEQ